MEQHVERIPCDGGGFGQQQAWAAQSCARIRGCAPMDMAGNSSTSTHTLHARPMIGSLCKPFAIAGYRAAGKLWRATRVPSTAKGVDWLSVR